jgi:hypothetical protein
MHHPGKYDHFPGIEDRFNKPVIICGSNYYYDIFRGTPINKA